MAKRARELWPENPEIFFLPEQVNPMSSDHFWINNPGFTSVSVDFRLNGNVGTNDPRLYWAFSFFFENKYDANAAGGYFGYQPFGNPIASTANGSAFPLVNYSLWGAENGVAGPGGESGIFTNEGSGLRTYIPYAIQPGRDYNFELAKNGKVLTLNVTDKTSGVKTLVGKINTKIDVGNLISAAVWSEVYSPVSDGAAFESTDAVWSNIRFNGQSTEFLVQPFPTENYSTSTLVSHTLTRYKSYIEGSYRFVTGPETLKQISITPIKSSVEEGQNANFLISTKWITEGTKLPFQVEGVSSQDIVGGFLNGNVTIGSTGGATINIPLAADRMSEGDETLTVTVQGKSTSTTVKDTSLAGAPVDNIPPTIAITSSQSSLSIGQTATLTFSISESVSDFAVGDIQVSGGTLSNFAGSGTIYSATFTPTANSSIGGVVSVASGKFSDAAGNFNVDGSDANNIVTMTVDTIPPTISIGSDRSTLAYGQTATITLTLSESATDFDINDITVTGGSPSNFNGSGKNYTLTFTPNSDSSHDGIVSVSSNKFSDAVGNFNIDGAEANNTATIAVNTVVAAPTTAWTQLLSSFGEIADLATGLDGSIYGCGFTTSTSLDGQTNAGRSDAFVVKYDSLGRKIWTRVIGGSGADGGTAITIGIDGSIYLRGETESTTFDGIVRDTSDGNFLTKYSPDGNQVWTVLAGGTGSYYGTSGLTTGLDGSLYLSGSIGADGFISRYDSNGKKLWVALSKDSTAGRLTTSLDGSIYVSGTTNSQTLNGQITAGFRDASLTKIDTAGSILWTRIIGSGFAQGCCTGLDGSVYVAGYSTSSILDGQVNQGGFDAFLVKYDSSGNKLWTRLIGGDGDDYGLGLTVGLDGSVYLTGFTSSSTIDGKPNPLETHGQQDGFITKYDPSGFRVWTRLIGSEGLDSVSAATTGLDGAIYVGGQTGSTTLNGVARSTIVDAFVAKIIEGDTTPPTIAISSNRSSLTVGQTATINFVISESVSDFVAGDVTVSTGTLSNFSGSGTSYTATFTPIANRTSNAVITVASNKFSDAAGNFNSDGADANNTVTFAVKNSKPISASATLTTPEDIALVFSKESFKFTDSDPSDSLQAVSITARPTKGTLKLNGASVSVNQIIPVADIVAGKLAFTPVADANGAAYAKLGFKVSDGKDLSTSTYYITINVTAVNDAPTVAKPFTTPLSLIEGRAFSFSLPSGTFKDVDDSVLTYSATGLLAGIVIDPKTGKISGTPGYSAADLESNTVTIKATDKAGLSASTPLTVKVTNTPTITGSRKDDNIVAGAGADSISGGNGNDILSGGAGNDTLVGGAGKDMLTGGDGADRFVFDTALGASNVDTIKDFLTGTDKIVLSAKVFGKLTGSSAGLAISAGNFVISAGATAVAKDNDDHLIYDTGTDLLYYDADGSGTGSPVAFVKVELTGTAAPAFGDFLVVS